jgi:hypothetical protein
MNDKTLVDRQQQVADSLRRVADALAGLDPADLAGLYVHVNMQPGDRAASEAAKMATIDAVANAVLGKPAETRELSPGTYHHTVAGHLPGAVHVSIYNSVTNPAERELHAELERLRAELAARDAAADLVTVRMSAPVEAVAE